MGSETSSWLVRWYARTIPPYTKNKPAQWDEDWVRGTVRFGSQVMIVGLVVLLVAVFLPNDSRRWFFVIAGALQVAIGHWLTRNAAAICREALAMGRNEDV
jgi:hypothetical protein